MNANPVFCCQVMANIVMTGAVMLVVEGDRILPSVETTRGRLLLKHCPDCGKELRLTFLSDTEVDG